MGKRQRLLIISIAFVLLQFAYVSAASTVNTSSVTDEWSMFRHDPSHSAYTTDARLADSVRVLWTFKTWKGVMSSTAVAHGCLFVGSRDWRVYCLNISSGEQIWNYSTGNEVNSSPAIYDGSVYVGSDDGYVYRIDIPTGTLLWKSASEGWCGLLLQLLPGAST